MADGQNFGDPQDPQKGNTNPAGGGAGQWQPQPPPPPLPPQQQFQQQPPQPPPMYNPMPQDMGAYPPPPPPGYGGGYGGPGMPPGGGMGDMGNMGGYGGYAPPPPPPEDNTPANFQLGAKLPPVLRVKVPLHELKFDEQYFLHLLAGSISLTKDEKRKIVESIPKLKQSQIDELVRIFEEERKKFAELSKKHTPQLESLAQKHFEEWMDLETEQEQKAKVQEDQSKADAIRKQLGL